MGSNKIELYDLSPKAREVIEWRAARRKVLRESYLKQVHNPIKQQLILDHGIHRYGVMRLTHQYQMKITGRTMLFNLGGVFAFICLATWTVKTLKGKHENLLRNGHISYADRCYTFPN
ncbi:PREDICTED: uncharacterized protein LOC107186892 [Dufourea novaeangliae]|uniref:NADH dehydrogenase [ubiquinone] 1 beta subcomplex subunit 4 n=1 Tax=Dufourea novaeangliae TaxID=178035 RepID=A0A154PA42_DUFNO|nr:PREDICTED: uncharacterized protein LOC107186892 [Dufourea novaeangliae]KZC08722.1 hypothetical protein WN55_10744 [Dufourea novaeangliae]